MQLHFIDIDTGPQQLRVVPWSETILKVSLSGPFSTGTPLSGAVVGESPGAQSRVSSTEGRSILETRDLAAELAADNDSIVFTRNGKLVTTLQNINPALAPRAVYKPLRPEDVNVEVTSGADGMRSTLDAVDREFDRTAYTGVLEFRTDPDEHLFGLGQHEEGHFDLRGQHQYLYQHNLKISIPILLSSRGYAVFVDGASAMEFSDGSGAFTISCSCVDRLEFYLIFGDTFDELIDGVHFLTGRPPMLPKALLGYVQSKERYVDQTEVLDTIREFGDRSIPLDVIVLDWRTWPEGLWGQKSLDGDRFPDPRLMIEEAHDAGVKTMLSIWPKMAGNGPDQEEFRQAGLLLGDGMTYNAFSEEAQNLYWDQLERGAGRFGFDYWWADCSEPFEADWYGATVGTTAERAAINVGFAEQFLDAGHISEYSLSHIEGLHRNHSVRSGKRFGLLTRSSFPGQQRYGAISWSGDVSGTWESIRTQIAAALNLIATGQPYWTFDIGGFFAVSKPEFWFWKGAATGHSVDPGYTELYVRWMQLGALMPVMRSHGTDLAREPWNFGEAGDRAYDSIVAAIELRKSLEYYLYAAMAESARSGRMYVRMLPFDFPNDEASYQVADQFMLGPDLLCAPVINAAANGGKQRSVWLPSGSGWYEFGTGIKHIGGSWIDIATDLDTVPMFVREGAVVPIVENEGIVLQVYPGADAGTEIYEDDGETNDYLDDGYRRRSVVWEERTRHITVQPAVGHWRGPSLPIRAEALDGGEVVLEIR